MKKGSNKFVLFFHIMVWVVLFSLPYLLSSGEQQMLTKVFTHSWIPLIFYALIFYLNYLGFIDWFLFRKKILWFVLINAVIICCSIWIRNEVIAMFFSDAFPKPPENGKGPPPKMFLYIHIISFIVPLVFSIALKTTERWVRDEAERKEIANYKLASELKYLRYQIQPHFFFNSLNNIYALVDVFPEQAKLTIHSLSKLMRYLLYETNTDVIALSKEIDFITKYIELMKLRLTENTEVVYNFPDTNTEIKVAPLLFISLIENAFKHGVSAKTKSTISFKMLTEGNKITFITKNPNFPKSDNDKSGSGIGLQNLEKRLQLLYPNKHEFNTGIKDNKFIATITINI